MQRNLYSSLVALLIIVVALSSVVNAYYQPPKPQVFWFTQKFDHLNASDTRTFQQRYLIYDDYYRLHNNSEHERPIFFTPGGEADVFGGYNHNGFMFQYGRHLGAFMLFPEHRFYGQSLPFGPVDSFNAQNIPKLTIELAMMDYIEIIKFVRNKYNISTDAPLFTFGGSYPGELAAFMRVKYPQFVDGALASSAPLRYHPFLPHGTPSGSFYGVITHDFALHDPICPTLVRSAFNRMQNLFATADGRAQLSKELQLCSTIGGDPSQLRLIHLWAENAFATLGMEDYPYAVPPFPANPMLHACDKMRFNVKDETLLHNLGQAIGIAYNTSGSLTCFNITEEYFPCADITGCGTGPDALSWDYQSCTEIIANVDTNNVTDMFPPAPYNFTALTNYCQKTWNATPDPLKTTKEYNYLKSSRIIFSNGLLDPWFPGGVLVSQSNSLIALQALGSAHHLDLRGSDPADPHAVQRVRKEEERIINNWMREIAEAKHSNRKH